jgi:hypothetical protein
MCSCILQHINNQWLFVHLAHPLPDFKSSAQLTLNAHKYFRRPSQRIALQIKWYVPWDLKAWCCSDHFPVWLLLLNFACQVHSQLAFLPMVSSGFIFRVDCHSAQHQACYRIVWWLHGMLWLTTYHTLVTLTSVDSAPRIIFEPPGMPKSCSIVWPTNSIYFLL